MIFWLIQSQDMVFPLKRITNFQNSSELREIAHLPQRHGFVIIKDKPSARPDEGTIRTPM